MKQKLLIVSALLLVFFSQISQAQNTSSDYLVRTTTGVAGSLENNTINNKSYLVQQSIGKAKVLPNPLVNNFSK